MRFLCPCHIASRLLWPPTIRDRQLAAAEGRKETPRARRDASQLFIRAVFTCVENSRKLAVNNLEIVSAGDSGVGEYG